MRWRLIVDGAQRGAHNMAVDEALVEAVDRGESPPVLRLYRWEPACLSLGFAQPFKVADAGFCAANGVDLVRRPTGGRAVLHHLEQTYCVLARLGEDPFSTDLQAAYQGICRALVAGLLKLGAPAGLAGAPASGHIKPTEAIPCFIGPASGEVVANGRKLIGSAMRRHNRSILQHGSLLEDWDGRLQAGCLGLADDSTLRPAVTTLRELMGAQARSRGAGPGVGARVRGDVRHRAGAVVVVRGREASGPPSWPGSATATSAGPCGGSESCRRADQSRASTTTRSTPATSTSRVVSCRPAASAAGRSRSAWPGPSSSRA